MTTTSGRDIGGTFKNVGSGLMTLFVGDNATSYRSLRNVCKPGMRTGRASLGCLGGIVDVVGVVGYASDSTCRRTSFCMCGVRPSTRTTAKYTCRTCGGKSVSNSIGFFSRTVGLRASGTGGTRGTCTTTDILAATGGLSRTESCTRGTVDFGRGCNTPCVLVTGLCTVDPG